MAPNFDEKLSSKIASEKPNFLMLKSVIPAIRLLFPHSLWNGDRLARRGSLVQTPLKGVKISAF